MQSCYLYRETERKQKSHLHYLLSLARRYHKAPHDSASKKSIRRYSPLTWDLRNWESQHKPFFFIIYPVCGIVLWATENGLRCTVFPLRSVPFVVTLGRNHQSHFWESSLSKLPVCFSWLSQAMSLLTVIPFMFSLNLGFHYHHLPWSTQAPDCLLAFSSYTASETSQAPAFCLGSSFSLGENISISGLSHCVMDGPPLSSIITSCPNKLIIFWWSSCSQI